MPNQTLYVRNLSDKMSAIKLKEALYVGFSQYGAVLDVVAKRTYKLRGHVWVVFGDVASATQAMQCLNGYNFYGKPMDIQYARSKSDVIAKRDGTFKPRPLRKRKAASENGDANGALKKAAVKGPALKPSSRAATVVSPNAAPARVDVAHSTPPNKILFAENLPPKCTSEMLQVLFQQYAGFKEVRFVSGKGVAFIEYDTEASAGIALQGLNNFKLQPTVLMRLSYAKK